MAVEGGAIVAAEGEESLACLLHGTSKWKSISRLSESNVLLGWIMLD